MENLPYDVQRHIYEYAGFRFRSMYEIYRPVVIPPYFQTLQIDRVSWEKGGLFRAMMAPYPPVATGGHYGIGFKEIVVFESLVNIKVYRFESLLAYGNSQKEISSFFCE